MTNNLIHFELKYWLLFGGEREGEEKERETEWGRKKDWERDAEEREIERVQGASENKYSNNMEVFIFNGKVGRNFVNN